MRVQFKKRTPTELEVRCCCQCGKEIPMIDSWGRQFNPSDYNVKTTCSKECKSNLMKKLHEIRRRQSKAERA